VLLTWQADKYPFEDLTLGLCCFGSLFPFRSNGQLNYKTFNNQKTFATFFILNRNCVFVDLKL
jgi:hypothetical protein